MADGYVAAGNAHGLGLLQCLAVQQQMRLAGRAGDRLHLIWPDALAEPRAQSLDGRLLGGKSSGHVVARMPGHTSQFFWPQNFFGKTQAEAVKTFFYTGKINYVDAHAYYHFIPVAAQRLVCRDFYLWRAGCPMKKNIVYAAIGRTILPRSRL